MNWKNLPLLIATATLAGVPIILMSYHDPKDATAQIFAGIGMALIFGLGLGTVIRQRVWRLNQTSHDDMGLQVTGIIVLAIVAAVLSEMATWVMPIFGLAVFSWLWACAYAFASPFFD